MHTVKNSEVGLIDTHSKVGTVEPTGLKDEWVTIFGERVKPILGVSYRIVKQCFDLYGSIPSEENEWEPTKCISCYDMYN